MFLAFHSLGNFLKKENGGPRGFFLTYSFAKTPLNAAQAPLAMVRAIHVVHLLTAFAFVEDVAAGSGFGEAGTSGSTSACMVDGVRPCASCFELRRLIWVKSQQMISSGDRRDP